MPDVGLPFRTRHGAGTRMTVHRHQVGYASVVIAGSYLELSVDGRFAIQAGDLVLHPPFHAHGDRFAREATLILNVELPDDDLPGESRVVRLPQAQKLVGAIRAQPHRAMALVRDALNDARGARVRPLLPPARLAQAAAALSEPLPIRVGNAARLAGVSLEHFSRAFTTHFGIPPVVYRSEHRFRRAARLIGSGCRLADAALQAGYADQSHMTRDFRSRSLRAPGSFAGHV